MFLHLGRFIREIVATVLHRETTMRYHHLAVFAFCLSCADSTEPLPEPRFDTAAKEYLLPAGHNPALISYTIHNRGSEALYVGRCGEFISAMYERLEDGKWEPTGGGYCQTDRIWWPWTILSGEAHQGVAYIYGPGTYQLVIHAADVPDRNQAYHLRSNIFVVR